MLDSNLFYIKLYKCFNPNIFYRYFLLPFEWLLVIFFMRQNWSNRFAEFVILESSSNVRYSKSWAFSIPLHPEREYKFIQLKIVQSKIASGISKLNCLPLKWNFTQSYERSLCSVGIFCIFIWVVITYKFI